MKVLVCLDGSKISENALQVALDTFGGNAENELVLMSVVQKQDVTGTVFLTGAVEAPVLMSQEVYDQLDRANRRHQDAARSQLHKYAEEARAKAAAKITPLLVEGSPRESILFEAEHLKADTLVLGSRGLGTVSRLLMGSVSAHIVNHAHCNVLVVKPRN